MIHIRASISVGLMLAAAVTLAACANTRAPADDPAIAAIYADADARAAQTRAQQLRLTATAAAQATATAVFAPMAAQTQVAYSTEAARISQLATAAPIATSEAVMAQTATAAPFATATASVAQTAEAAPAATQQAQQALLAQTAVVAPTATWQAFQLEAARRDAQARAEQEEAVVNRLLDLAWIGALVIFVAAGVIIVGRQIARALTQTTLARATAATTVEQARAATERERQKAEEARARAAHARPPVYVIDEHSESAPARTPPRTQPGPTAHPGSPMQAMASGHLPLEHGDDDIHFIWETQLDESDEPAGGLEQTSAIIIEHSAHRPGDNNGTTHDQAQGNQPIRQSLRN